jgi:hypothetical protein
MAVLLRRCNKDDISITSPDPFSLQKIKRIQIKLTRAQDSHANQE